jgi:hypothetical protein
MTTLLGLDDLHQLNSRYVRKDLRHFRDIYSPALPYPVKCEAIPCWRQVRCNCTMNDHIDQFHEDIRAALSTIDVSLIRVKALFANKTMRTEQDLREQLGEVEKSLEQSRQRAAAAHLDLERWLDEESDRVAEWRVKRDTSKLHARADKCEQCAAAAIEVAIAAVD